MSISNDGRFVLWVGLKNTNLLNEGSNAGGYHLYITDMKDHSVKLLTPRDGTSIDVGTADVAQMSCDGSLIVTSSKDQLTTDDTDSAEDVFLIDLRNGFNIKNLSAASSLDTNDPSISCNGNYITFESKDYVFDSAVPSTSTKSHVYLYDRIDASFSVADVSGTGTLSTVDSYGMAGVDDQGNVVYNGNNSTSNGNSYRQMFLKHKNNGLLEKVTREAYCTDCSHVGTIYRRASISSDGKRVVYGISPTASSLFIPASGSGTLAERNSNDSNGKGDVVMSLTGL